ncbi:hypothetical protein ACFQU2_40560 [Siccirubricoccus deserti]
MAAPAALRSTAAALSLGDYGLPDLLGRLRRRLGQPGDLARFARRRGIPLVEVAEVNAPSFARRCAKPAPTSSSPSISTRSSVPRPWQRCRSAE